MKRIILLTLLGAATLSLTGCMGGIEMLNFGRKAPAPAACNTGRFQVVGIPSGTTAGSAIKIDTTTGETWIYSIGGVNEWAKLPK